jgi:hypothetical protein
MAEREATLAERTAERPDAQSAAQVARLGEQAAGERSERELAERMRDPASPESGRARGQMQALLESVGERGRSRVQPLLDQLQNMSADDVERMQQRGPAWLRDLLHRRGGAGGTGGGGGGQTRAGVRAAIVDRIAGPDATPEQRAAAEQEADAYIGALGSRRAAQSVLTDRLARGRQEEGREASAERTTGQRTDTDTERLGRAMDSSLSWTQSLRAARRIDPSLLQAVFLSRNIPPGFTPEQVQSARGVVERMISARANLLSGAAVSEPELARITSGMGASATSSPQAFMDFLGAEEQAERERGARIRARFSDDVVRTYDRRLQREQAPGAPQAPTGGTRPRRVPMISPEGRRGTLPEEQVEEAIRAGWRRG